MEQKIQMTQEPRDGVALREGDFPNRQPPVRALPSGISLRAVPTLVSRTRRGTFGRGFGRSAKTSTGVGILGCFTRPPAWSKSSDSLKSPPRTIRTRGSSRSCVTSTNTREANTTRRWSTTRPVNLRMRN